MQVPLIDVEAIAREGRYRRSGSRNGRLGKVASGGHVPIDNARAYDKSKPLPMPWRKVRG